MDLEVIRKRRVPLGLALLVLILWIGAGIRRAGGEGWATVLDSPFGLFAPRLVDTGWQFAPAGLARISIYPTSATTYTFRDGGGRTALRSREGVALVATGAIHYRIDPERILEVHDALGPGFERTAIARWVEEDLRRAIARSDYGAISGARVEELQAEVGQSLAERFRTAGLELLSCEIAEFRIRTDHNAEAIASRRVPGMRVVLIGLDGADWNILDPLIEAGRVPNLARLVREGVRGRLRSITPMLSPVIWTSMATGALPTQHGIVDFVATTGREGERIPVTSSLRRVKAIWNILSDNGVRVGVVGWWATYPAEPVDGFIVSDRVAYQLFGARPVRRQPREGKVYPPDIDDLVMSLVVEPESISSRDLRRYISPARDVASLPAEEIKRVEDFRTLLAAGDTYAAVSVELARKFKPDFEAFYLEGTDTVAHLFMPYAPPAREGTDAQDRRRYGRAVGEYYRHADEMVGRLIEACAPTAVIVCSDHGFRTGDNRPVSDPRIGYGPAADWHRKYGIVILHGEAFRGGHVLREASVLDITPTVLALFGFPIGEDMAGRPITEAFDPAFLAAHPIAYIPSYEGTVATLAAGAGEGPQPGATPAPTDPEGDLERIEKLRSLGYLGSDTANSHNNRGLMLLEEGRFDEAIREFELAIDASENQSAAWLSIARAYFGKKDYAAATEAVNRLLERQPASPEAENLLGNIEMEQGHDAEAERHLERALDLNPNSANAHNSLGILYVRLGRLQEAIERFRRVVAIDGDYGEAYNNIGAIYKKEGRLDEAIAAFRRAIDADPDFVGSYSNLALALEERGEVDAAGEQFRKAIGRAPGNAAVRTNYGAFLYRLGKLEEAREELERAVELDPDYAPARNNLGAVHGRLGQPDEEIADYRAAVSIDPGYADACHNLGLALVKTGEVAEGEGQLRKALEIDPGYGPAYINLGRLYIGQGKYIEASTLLARGTEKVPRNADIRGLLGESYLRLGRRDEAIAAFQAALALRPDQAELRRRVDALLDRERGGPEDGSPEHGGAEEPE